MVNDFFFFLFTIKFDPTHSFPSNMAEVRRIYLKLTDFFMKLQRQRQLCEGNADADADNGDNYKYLFLCLCFP